MVLFDIDGVIRDVSGSYRRALVETVHHYSGWRPDPACVDALKGEGRWNNDWDASLELLRRQGVALPQRDALVGVFSGFYFGGDPDGSPPNGKGSSAASPAGGAPLFEQLSAKGCPWDSSAELSPFSPLRAAAAPGASGSALIAMGDAPRQPDPTGLIRLSDQLRPPPKRRCCFWATPWPMCKP